MVERHFTLAMSGTDPRSLRLSLVTSPPELSFYGRRNYGGGPVLVLGAGDGRVALEIAAHGTEVWAVEPSGRMLEALKTRMASERPAVVAKVRLLQADPRTLQETQRFEAVVAPHNALALMHTQEDLFGLFVKARQHLLPHGTLVFDLTHVSGPDGFSGRQGTGLIHEQRLFVPHVRLRKNRRDLETVRRFRGRLFGVEEVDEALEAAGFLALERFGSFSGKPFAPEDPLQIVVAALSNYDLSLRR